MFVLSEQAVSGAFGEAEFNLIDYEKDSHTTGLW